MTVRPGWLKRTWVRRTLIGVVVFGLLAVAAAGGYVGLVTVRHDRSMALPPPTGPDPVGRVTFDWTDHRRIDPLAPHSGTDRELAVWLWYPAARSPAAPRTAYTPGDWSRLHLPSLAGLAESRFGAVRTHSYAAAPVAAGRFPVVVFEPGMGFAAPQYAALAENIASHGYLVAGVTPTYSANHTVLNGHAVGSTTAGNPHEMTAARGDRLVRIWAADAGFTVSRVEALDRSGRFAGHIDPTRTAYVGHSFGGAASAEECHADRRCAGAVDLDGEFFGPVVHSGVRAPLLVVGSENSCVTGTCRPGNADDRAARASARSLFAASTAQTWCYTIDGTEHFNFTDYAAYYLAAPLRRLLALGPIDGDRGLTITGAYLTAFLDHTVHGTSERLLDGTSRPYEQVRTCARNGGAQ